ncbi:ATP-binding protein [Magnetospirillum sulfuroxidans]|uniref:ATP-binding protein n=1 Tax=Magnetospirillum sulfuroxidans TaxID=611300 RepID=UPI0031FF4402
MPVVAVLLLACLSGLLIAHLWSSHTKAQADARLMAATLAQAIEQHVGGQMRGIAALLDETGAQVQANHHQTPAILNHLRERLTAFPEIDELIVLDNNGRTLSLMGDQQLALPQVTWLLSQMGRGEARLVVGPPYVDASQGRRLMVVARIFVLNGGPAAVVTLTDANSLAAFLETVRVVETDMVAVVHGSGLIAAAAPDHQTLFARLAVASPEQIGATLPVENLDLRVWVAASHDSAFQLWRVNAALEIALFLLFCFAILAWARRGDLAWRQVISARDGLEELVVRRGIEVRQARAVLEQRARQVSAANRELQRLSMVAAHHLQEPLRPLVSYSQMLGRRLPGDLLTGQQVLAHLIQGGKDMKALLKGFQQRVASLSIDAPAEAAELRQVMQRAMVDAGTGVAIRPESLPVLSVQRQATGELLVQIFRTLDGLGAASIAVGARHRPEGWQLVVRGDGALREGAENSVAVRVCLSLAGLNDQPLTFADATFYLDLPPSEAEETDAMPPTQAEPTRGEFGARFQALGLIAALAAAGFWQVERERDSAIHAAQVLTRAVANSIDQQISGSLRGIDTILAEAAAAIEQGDHLSLAFSVRMEAILRAFPEIRHVGLADAAGQMSTLVWPPRLLPENGIAITDRSYFTRAKADPAQSNMVIGDPVRGRIGDERSLHVARPLRSPKGRFNGIVFANVDPDLYARFLDRVLLDREGGTALIGADGKMIARAPAHVEKFGMDISSSDLFTRWLPASPIGTAHLISKADGNDKYLAYRLLSPYPLVVTSAVSRNKALVAWRQGLGVAIGAVALLSIALLSLAWMVDHGMTRIRRQHGELAAEVLRRTHGLEAARALSDARAASLERLNGQLRDLLGVVTRDLEVPLAALQADVRILTGVLEVEAGDPHRQDEVIYVSTAITRLSVLLRDFQRFVSIISMSAQMAPVDLSALVRLVADDMARRFGPAVLLVEADSLPVLNADGGMLMELLNQVFANAITYRGRDHAVRVRVRASRRESDWVLEICDDGPGLSQEQLSHDPQAFEAGVGQSVDSTGIGLAICRVIAQAHGGDMWLGKGDEGGTTVSVALPA